MLQKVTATLFLVVLSLALIACPSDSTTAGPELAAAASQTAITAGALTEYTLLFDKAVSAVATAGLSASEFTIKNGEAAAVEATEAKIVGTTGDDAKKVKLTFAEITFVEGAKVVFTVKSNAVKDSEGNENTAARTVELTVGAAAAAAGPVLKDPQTVAIAGGTAITSYILEFDKEIAAVSGKTLTDEFTMTNDGTDVPLTTVTIQTADATKVDLEFTSLTPVAGKSVVFTVAAGAVQDTAATPTVNAETSVTVTVGN